MHRVFCQPAEFDRGDSGRRQHSGRGSRNASAIDRDCHLQQRNQNCYQLRELVELNFMRDREHYRPCDSDWTQF